MLKAAILSVLVTLVVSSIIAGGWSKWREDVDDERTMTAANFAVGELSSKLNGQYHVKLVQIHRYRTQIVAGKNYNFELTIGKTDCKKSEVDYSNIDQCEVQDGENTKCTIIVYRDLKNRHSLTSSACSSS